MNIQIFNNLIIDQSYTEQEGWFWPSWYVDYIQAFYHKAMRTYGRSLTFYTKTHGGNTNIEHEIQWKTKPPNNIYSRKSLEDIKTY